MWADGKAQFDATAIVAPDSAVFVAVEGAVDLAKASHLEFGPPSVMGLEDVPDPQPGPGQVVVELKAAGVNPIDCYIRSGSYTQRPALPYIPGVDGAGVVRSLGPEVTTVAPLDRVYITGTIGQLAGTSAELVLCHAFQVKPLPPTVSFAQGAAVNVSYAAAGRALFHKARVVPGERVLVHGASGGPVSPRCSSPRPSV